MWMRGLESNQQHRITKPVCYHYTTPQKLRPDIDRVPTEHRERLEAVGNDIRQRSQRRDRGLTGNHIIGRKLAAAAFQRKTIYLTAIHFCCNTSHQTLQIVEKKATQRVGKAAYYAPLEAVKEFHRHIACTPQLVPPAPEAAIEIHEKLKVHIQRAAPL